KAHGSDVRTIISSANSTRSCRECYKRLVNKARWVVCNGQGLYEDIKQAEIVAPDRLLSIPIGVDTRIFHELNFAERSLYRNNCGIPGQAVLWLFVGTWIDYKGT